MFCQELKTVLKETIELWNGYHEGTKAFKDLGKGKGAGDLKDGRITIITD